MFAKRRRADEPDLFARPTGEDNAAPKFFRMLDALPGQRRRQFHHPGHARRIVVRARMNLVFFAGAIERTAAAVAEMIVMRADQYVFVTLASAPAECTRRRLRRSSSNARPRKRASLSLSATRNRVSACGFSLSSAVWSSFNVFAARSEERVCRFSIDRSCDDAAADIRDIVCERKQLTRVAASSARLPRARAFAPRSRASIAL